MTDQTLVVERRPGHPMLPLPPVLTAGDVGALAAIARALEAYRREVYPLETPEMRCPQMLAHRAEQHVQRALDILYGADEIHDAPQALREAAALLAVAIAAVYDQAGEASP